MKTLADLLKEKRAKIEAQKAIRAKAVEEKRDKLSTEENVQFRAIQKEIEDLEEEIRDAKAYEDNLRSLAGAGAGEGTKKPEEEDLDKMAKRFSLHKGLLDVAEGRSLTGIEKEVHEEGVRQAKAAGKIVAGFALPTSIQKRFAGQSVTQDAGEYGAALVNEDSRGMVDFLRPKPILESAGATYLTGLQGDVKFIINEGGIIASWEGEVDLGATSKNKYSNKGMKPKRLYAGVPISIMNIKQSSIDIEAYTRREINDVMANALDLAAINGSGANDQPLGLLNTPNLPVIAIGANGGAYTWAHIVAQETSVFVENANAARMAYLINPVTKGKLKTTKHDAGDLNYLMTSDNNINGYPVAVSNLVPGNIGKGTGTNLSASIYGDMSQLIIGQWGFVDLVLDKSTAGSGYYMIHVNGFFDVLVRQIKSFAAIKDISNA